MNILWKPVKNFTKGRDGIQPEGICIHVGEGSMKTIYQTFQYEEKSSHYNIGPDEIWQHVAEENQAWTQGIVIKPTSKLVIERSGQNPNKFLISLENSGFGHLDIPESQYQLNAELVKNICKRYAWEINRYRIIGHREIRNDKTCPGKINIDKIIASIKKTI